MKKKLQVLMAAILAVTLAAAGCTGQAPAPQETSPTSTEAESKETPAETTTEAPETETPEETTAAQAQETEAAAPELIEAPQLTAETFPRTDGSTATLPLSWMLYRLCTGADQAAAEEALHFTKTNNAYINLMEGNTDLVIAYEPGPGAKADERYGDIEMKPIGLDALIFICNTDNPVESLTTEQIRDIYTGKLTNWKEAGGEDAPIIAFQRPVNSGSQTLMENLMMQGTPMTDAPMELRPTEMGDLIESVAYYSNSGNAFGYSVYFYAKNMYTKPNLRFMAVDGVMPSNDTIRSGEYAYTNPFYVAIRKDEPKDSAAYKLFEWLTTEDGQSLVEAMDYVSVTKGTKELPEELKEAPEQAVLEGNTHRIALNGVYYDGDAGVVFIDEKGAVAGREDSIRIRNDEDFALIRGSVFPASLPIYYEKKAEGESEEEWPGSLPVGLYDVDKKEWAVEPKYDFCYTECMDGVNVIYYMGNWQDYGYYDQHGNYVEYDDLTMTLDKYDQDGARLGTAIYKNWDELNAMTANCLGQRGLNYDYYEDTEETVYHLGGETDLIICYGEEESAVLQTGGRAAASSRHASVLPYMADISNDDMIPFGWNLVHMYDIVEDEDDYRYVEAGDYIVDDGGKIVFVSKNGDQESIRLIDEHFILLENYDSNKNRLIDYQGREILTWIAPDNFEYTDW